MERLGRKEKKEKKEKEGALTRIRARPLYSFYETFNPVCSRHVCFTAGIGWIGEP